MVILALFAVLVPGAAPSRARAAPKKTMVIRDVTVIDCTGHAPRPGMSVVIADGRIAVIGRATRVRALDNAEILDGRGKYLIPGLWNMHVHLGKYADGKAALPQFLMQGVTGVRDMGSPLDDILRLRQETDDGTIPGPHMAVAGPIVQGPLPFRMPVFIAVTDTIMARETVNMLQERGVDFIKVQDTIPHDSYIAIADQARRNHISFVGHIPPTVLPEEACDHGQRSIEHLGGRFWGVLLGSSAKQAVLHAKEIQPYQDILSALANKQPPPTTNMRAAFIRTVVESYDPHKAASLMRRFRKNGTWQCPTLVTLQTLWNDASAQYTVDDHRWAERLLAKSAELIPIMQRNGVGLLAGTDLPPNAKNGTIHDELASLVAAGLTPLQALQAATRNAATFLGRSRAVGTIERQKAADLMLLDANPLADIRNTTRIAAVIVRGQIAYRHISDASIRMRPATIATEGWSFVGGDEQTRDGRRGRNRTN